MSQSNTPFVHLGARSEISFGESIARVEELCWEAARDEQGYLALTDVNSLGRAPAFASAAARSGLRPVFGAELSVLPFGDLQYRGAIYRVRLLAEDLFGWRNLLRLVNHARENETNDRPAHTTFAKILEGPRGLLMFLGGERGELTQLIKDQQFERVEEIVGELRHAGVLDRCFLELPPLNCAEDRELARAMHTAAMHFELLPAAVPKVVCAHAADEPLFRLLHGEKPARPIRMSDLSAPLAKRDCLQPRHVIAERYADFPDALEVTLEAAQHCSRFELPTPKRRFPIHDFVRGVDAESFIWNTAFQRAGDRYGELPPRYKERLDREFREIVEAGLSNAVVTLTRLVEEFEAKGVQRGPGGGLFTNSLVASLLGLTRLDPLRFDLNFEIPPGLMAGAFPMLELSVPMNQEAEAVDALQTLFNGQVTPIGQWKPWKFNPAFEAVAAAMGLDSKQAGNILKQKGFASARKQMAAQPVTYQPSDDSSLESQSVLAWLAGRLEGRVRSLEPAPGEYTFAVEFIAQTVSQRRIPAGGTLTDGLPVCEWSSAELGALRHGRIAFKHPRLLDLVGEATALAREQGAIEYSPEHSAPDDAGVYALLREGKTAGIAPLESPLIRRKLRQGQPADLHSLIRLLTKNADEGPLINLPDILLCHVCAAVKSAHPNAFFAAALTQANGERRRMGILMEEIRERKIRIAEVDINLSGWKWSADRNGLRPGFIVVKGMTSEAAREIVEKRRELHFADLAELCQRTDKSRLKARHLRNLLHAGALDTWEVSRATLDRQLEELFPLLRPKGAGSFVTQDEDMSFFGRDPGWWVRQYGQPEDDTPDDPRELQRQEIEACGFAVHLAAPVGEEKFLKGARVRCAAQLTIKEKNQPVTLCGVLGPLDPDPRHPSAMLADVGGCLVRADGRLAERLGDPVHAGQRVLVTGILEREALQWRMELEAIHGIEEAISESLRAESITLDLSAVPEENQRELLAWLRRFPGPVPLAMEWLPAEPPALLKKIASRHVLYCPLLVHGLNSFAGAAHWSVAFSDAERAEHTALEEFANRLGLARLSASVQRWREGFRRKAES